MEGSPDQNINEDRGYKSEDLSDGETPVPKAGKSDNKLEKVAKIKMFPNQKEDKFQLSVREEIPLPRGLNTKETEEEATVKMNVRETAFENYDLVLQKTMQEQLDKCKEAMRMFPYFNTWSDASVMECCALSKIERYEMDQTILGDGKGKQNFVYFILKGQCQMIQHMELAVHEINRHKCFRLHSEEVPMKSNEHLESYFMQVCLMNRGECFDIGENLKDRSLIATTEVECLLCPSHWLMKNSKANIWQKIKHFLDTYLPTKEQLFKEFLTQRRWLDYREKLVKDIVRKSNIHSDTTIHDVPYSIRIKEGVKLYNN